MTAQEIERPAFQPVADGRTTGQTAADREAMVRGMMRTVIPAAHLAGWATVTYRPLRLTRATAVIVQECVRECLLLGQVALTELAAWRAEAYTASGVTAAREQSTVEAISGLAHGHAAAFKEALAVVKACATPHQPLTTDQILDEWARITGLELGDEVPATYAFPAVAPRGTGWVTLGLAGKGRWTRVTMTGTPVDEACQGVVNDLLDALLDPERPADGHEDVVNASVIYQQARDSADDGGKDDAYTALIESIDVPTQVTFDAGNGAAAAQLLSGYAAMAWAAFILN